MLGNIPTTRRRDATSVGRKPRLQTLSSKMMASPKTVNLRSILHTAAVNCLCVSTFIYIYTSDCLPSSLCLFTCCLIFPVCRPQWRTRTPGGWSNFELLTRRYSPGGETPPKLPGSKNSWRPFRRLIHKCECVPVFMVSVLTHSGPSWRSSGCRGKSQHTRWQRNGTIWRGDTRYSTRCWSVS